METSKKGKGEIKMVGGKWAWIGILGLVVLFSTSVALEAANRDFNKAETVRIGVLDAVQLPVGQGTINAAKLAAEEINASGGILGKKSS